MGQYSKKVSPIAGTAKVGGNSTAGFQGFQRISFLLTFEVPRPIPLPRVGLDSAAFAIPGLVLNEYIPDMVRRRSQTLKFKFSGVILRLEKFPAANNQYWNNVA